MVSSNDLTRTQQNDVESNVPDDQARLVRSLLNYDAPHFFAKFTILGVPTGLEILDKYEHLLITKRLQNSIELPPDKLLQAYSQFDIKNSRGMQLYIAVETVENKSLHWVRDARLFNVTFFDFHCRRVFSVKRIKSLKYFFAQYLCLFFTFGFKGCGNAVDVVLPDGKKLGSIKQKLTFSSSSTFHVYNESGKNIMLISGIVTDGILDVTFPDEDEPIAMIETLMNDIEAFDFYRVYAPTHSSVTGITFFKDFVTPQQKSLLMGAAILLDYIALKPTSDYPHFCEVIPDDYLELSMPNCKMHRDGSKELLILTEGKSNRKHGYKTSKRKGRWGCCIWCGKLMCMCCLLGVKRNAIRCICLTIALAMCTTFFVIIGIMFYKNVLSKENVLLH